MFDQRMINALVAIGRSNAAFMCSQCDEMYYVEFSSQGEVEYCSRPSCKEHDDVVDASITGDELLALWYDIITATEDAICRADLEFGRDWSLHLDSRRDSYTPSNTFKIRHIVQKHCGCDTGNACEHPPLANNRYWRCNFCGMDKNANMTEFYKDVHPMQYGQIICQTCVGRYTWFCTSNRNHYSVYTVNWSPAIIRGWRYPGTTNSRPSNTRPNSRTCQSCLLAGPLNGEDLGLYTCRWCGYYIQEDFRATLPATDEMSSNLSANLGAYDNEDLCQHCWDGLHSRCSRCDLYATRNEINSGTGQMLCGDCIGNTVVRSYSYKPTPRFHGESKDGLYMGMEIETCFKHPVRAGDWVARHGARFDTSLWYIKSDSSLSNGVEFVTHPFTPEWGLSNFPFSTWQDMIDNDDIYPDHQTAGGHIHVSKSAFSAVHMYKWLMFHWNRDDFCQLVGRRAYPMKPGGLTLDTIATPDKRDEEVLRKFQERGGSLSDKEGMHSGAYLIAKKKISGRIGRSYGVATTPPHTMELRYPSGASDPQVQKIMMQYIRFIYDFTNRIRVTDIKAGALDTDDYIYGELEAAKDRFPELYNFVMTRTPTPTRLPSAVESGS